MLSILDIISVILDNWWDIEEDLSVSKGPVACKEHEDRSTLKEINSSLVQLLIKHWWLSVVVSQGKSLNNIHVEYSNECNWEHYWNE